VQIVERLNQIGFERPRRAIAALALSLFVFFYLLVALNPPAPDWALAFGALALCYGVAFMGVAAEWFWGRWFASGLGYSGVMVAAVSMVMLGWNPALAIYGGLHALVTVLLAGKKMADRYDLQAGWRERYSMDEFGVARLRKTVTRASASLPSVILWALGPKDPGQGMLALVAGLAAAGLALGGLRAVVRLRSWGLLAFSGAAALLLIFKNASTPLHILGIRPGVASLMSSSIGATLAAALLALAVAPFVAPIARHLARSRA
jgi:hypothetical protein